jgi:large subunit ribosomal protein L10
MPKTRQQKQEAVAALEEMISEATGILVIAPKAINPNEAAELKIKLDEIGGEYHMVKNSLFKLAVEKAGLEEMDAFNSGQNAVIFVGDKSPEAAKIVKEFIKETNKAEFKQGVLEGNILSKQQVEALADLPSRDELIAQVLATMNAPISGFVNVLAGNVRGIVNVIDAIKAQKQEA